MMAASKPPGRCLPAMLCLLAGLVAPSWALPARAAPALLEVPPGVTTHADGRAPIEQLYASWLRLLESGWTLDVIAHSQPAGTANALPIIALRSPACGPAAWFLSGIHGEETAGPNALAAAIDELAALGQEVPVVILPLNNPQGYARNWRYLNVPVYDANVDGQSVGDSSHLLPDPERPGVPRAATASSPEADAITRYVLDQAACYPPRYSIDLHEDNLIDEGYVYSQGALGAADPLAIEAVAVLRESGIPIKMDGQTRFDEPISGGIIGPVTDSSIDELMSAATVIVDGEPRTGPGARTVLVFETPARSVSFEQRKQAHLALIIRLAGQIAAGEP